MYDCCQDTQPPPRIRIVHQRPIRNRVVRVNRFHTPDFGTYEIRDGPFSETEANTCCYATFNDACNDTCNDSCNDTNNDTSNDSCNDSYNDSYNDTCYDTCNDTCNDTSYGDD
uniref:Probable ATP-dependent helicase PF08_0048 n=1 Tax=Drosophila rhopaloa TaxID=1041015 RepID=A0A6P4EMX5_DRORH